ncbi:LysR substrate-binding domain-containing protein [Labrys monachus]|uniref:DNA-binding transcriptional LysR family regulator n=1 Tax=Labrys monachus TaxID=217067 RepID=A0ABU0FL64_9HYPH|nr:LysR substrate-binding domain-containing protein [Labrys monachus]MDQ0395348.1 DNA-binding transcriptional LysR family regulator [Labrys monachus]
MDILLRHQLNALRAVEAAGRLGSMAKAAEELGVTVGAVSQQVHKAERRLRQPLFVRGPKGLVPTAFGAPLLAGLSRGFGEIARALSAAEGRAEHVLTVSVAPVFAAKWLVPRLARFRDLRPDLQVRIDASVELVDFAASDVDVGVRIGTGPWPHVRAAHLLDHGLFPACSPALAARIGGLDDLARVPIIRDHNSPAGWPTWLAGHGRAGMTLGPGPIFSDASLCLDAAVAGQGVMMAWRVLAQDALRDGRLVSPFPRPVPTGRSYWLVTSDRERASAKVKAFESWIRAELKE